MLVSILRIAATGGTAFALLLFIIGATGGARGLPGGSGMAASGGVLFGMLVLFALARLIELGEQAAAKNRSTGG